MSMQREDMTLQAAVANGDEAVVRLLLENGANVNVEGGQYSNVLQAAAVPMRWR